MPTTTKVSRTRDTDRTPKSHRDAAALARAYADRTRQRAYRSHPNPDRLWIDAYMRRYRHYTGRPLHAGPRQP